MTGDLYDEGTVIQSFSSGRAVHRISRMNSMAKNGQPIMMGEQQPLELLCLRPSSKHSGPIRISGTVGLKFVSSRWGFGA
jgi:hypothetical protein